MEKEQQSHTEIEGGKAEYTVTVGNVDLSVETALAAVREAAEIILVPLRSISLDLELRIMRHEVDPFVAFFELTDLLDDAYKAWVRDPRGGGGHA
jgi:hypothetical protein